MMNDAAMTQRSIEYDSLTPDYGTFLLEEVLPFVVHEHGIAITEDPERRTICGISSGGICAFTVAWQHTDSFRRVLSHCGSFTNIRGGHNYPYLIRSTPRKPLRVFLQSGANDAETLFGNWPLANKTMDDALRYAGYEHRFEFGSGGHSLRHGGALFADSLRWLWRTGETS
jgi:enterochelin esterase-like enzyme